MATKSSAVVSLPTLTQTGASVALKAAELYATEIGVPMSIAIVDAHTHLLAFTRMGTAKLSSIETSISMATTSASNRLPTSALSDQVPTTPLLNLTTQRLCTLPGGLPILSPTGALLGAIGCSTGTSLQGEDAAAAARDAVLALIKLESEEEERRIEEEREKVLRLWKEKEGEVESLKDELDYEREMRGSGKRRKTSSVGVGGGAGGLSVGVGGPHTPPEEGEITDFLKPSFVGEVRVGGF
ncbi:DUF336-domain-containing protein [Macroventuria anomochaeta]|uniref:DUF336-domain-containing protein n=1 Tax=Macroventuria anomochaeta TaxID=301207 RepID=A0ACB6RZ60_9PLEO|nr:DUF336-domain-containing protein [Macroventuria anomochaeta]KAF2627064.1 DUF336-domain-containing protein [Macroventuria anomochaeta]